MDIPKDIPKLQWHHKHTFFIILIAAIISGIIVYQRETHLGLDLDGGSHLVFQLQPTKEVKKITDNELRRVVEVIRKRIDLKGEFEAIVQPEGKDRVIVELPAVKDIKKAIEFVGKTAHLEFKDEKGKTILTGKDLKKAEVGFDQMNIPRVLIEFDKTGAKKFAKFTTQNVGKPLGIYLDGKLISNPEVREPIIGGKGEISGNFTVKEAIELANLLQGGALPVPLKRIEERTVGPSLGKDSIERGIKAGILAFLLILLFMIVYYRMPGVVACISLCLYVVFVFSIFEGIPITLTFPGIAGLILSLGMAVDANILIFERLREELRQDKTIKSAIDAAFSRAFPSILDSNITTLIAAAVLYYFGSGPVKGFAAALMTGILISMITAIVVSRTLLHLIVDTKFANTPFLLGVSAAQPYLVRKNVDFVGRRNIFFAISLLAIIVGSVYLFPPQNLNKFPPQTGLKLGIDFAGGSILQIKLKDETSVAKIRKILKEVGLEKSAIQQTSPKEAIIRTKELTISEKNEVEELFKKHKGDVIRFESVGPVIGKEIIRNAILAIIWAALLITIYLTIRFNQIRYGIVTIIAMAHDVLVILGIFAILGKILRVEIDSLFITAVLTIIGYSVNDTVVILDRIRENNKLKKASQTFSDVVNFSLQQTFARSINTSLTTLFAVVSLFLLAGPILKYFSFALLVGIISGAYSSMFNAAQILVVWDNFLKKRRTSQLTIKEQLSQKPKLQKAPSVHEIPSQQSAKTPQKPKKKEKGKQRRR